MVVATADRNIVVFNLANPQVTRLLGLVFQLYLKLLVLQGNLCFRVQTEYKRIPSPLKFQTRCVATFPDKQGFLVGSIEGRVAVNHIDDQQQAKNFTFKCHRDSNDIYSVNAMNFHPVSSFCEFTERDCASFVWRLHLKTNCTAVM